MLDEVAEAFVRRAPAVEHWSLRLVEETAERLSVRQGVVEPFVARTTRGAHVTVVDGGGVGYAATSELSAQGLAAAAERACEWAHAVADATLIDPHLMPRPRHRGQYETPVRRPWSTLSVGDKIDLLQRASRALAVDGRIVDWRATLGWRRTDVRLLSGAGARIAQTFHYLMPALAAVANSGAQTQQRTHGLDGARQGGLELLDEEAFLARAPRVAEEAIALLDAPECPAGRRDLVLTPRQMILQIHESIGHPLELDRILGDERNYAGTSFVTPDMFGRYRYGSPLLNVTFDPTPPEEVSSYGYDDEGTPAERVYLIRDGVLERPLGGAASQARASLPGVASARACDWSRPPIDRMANLNLEPGESRLEALIGAVERGVLMDTNRSWSIDDSRNKFQFGCELGRLIEDGELKGPVRNPGYRGISATFWRGLAGVGDAGTREILGVTTCGKGEPNQSIHTGHAAPACLFRDVEVFGGEAG